MAVIIDEVVFRARVAGTRPEASERREGGGGGPADHREIIEACVEEVMRILERKRER